MSLCQKPFEILIDRIGDEGDEDVGFDTSAAAVVHGPDSQVGIRDAEGLFHMPELTVILKHCGRRKLGIGQMSLEPIPFVSARYKHS